MFLIRDKLKSCENTNRNNGSQPKPKRVYFKDSSEETETTTSSSPSDEPRRTSSSPKRTAKQSVILSSPVKSDLSMLTSPQLSSLNEVIKTLRDQLVFLQQAQESNLKTIDELKRSLDKSNADLVNSSKEKDELNLKHNEVMISNSLFFLLYEKSFELLFYYIYYFAYSNKI